MSKKDWEKVIDEKIREAQERGDFDDLPGQGVPQPIAENPFAEPGQELAHKILKDAGFGLPWMELRKEIEKNQAEAEKAILRAHRWRLRVRATPGADLAGAEAEWQRALGAFHEHIEAINRQILTMNLQIPPVLSHLQRPRLKVHEILARLGVQDP